MQAIPRTGCAFYEREAGADDDGWTPTWEPLPELAPSRQRPLNGRTYHRRMPFTLYAPGATPEQLARGLEVARQVFAAAGVDAREAWAAFYSGVRGEAYSTWVLAEMAALDAGLGPGAHGARLGFTDDD